MLAVDGEPNGITLAHNIRTRENFSSRRRISRREKYISSASSNNWTQYQFI